jgi:NAD-dependent dihydropyrimidine dehydrogenase PreA subunit
MGWNVESDKDCCIGCGSCVEVCPQGVWEMVDGKAEAVNAGECVGCESCVEACEQQCIKVEET